MPSTRKFPAAQNSQDQGNRPECTPPRRSARLKSLRPGPQLESSKVGQSHLSRVSKTKLQKGVPSAVQSKRRKPIVGSPLHPISSPPQKQPEISTGAFTLQDTSSPARNLRKSLWETAYSSLRVQEPNLVDAYERLLSAHLGNFNSSPAVLASQVNDIEQDNTTKRLSQFKQIAEKGFTRIQAKAMTQYGSKKEDKPMGLLSEVIGKALVAVDETATPWVGIRFGLEILLDSASTQRVNHQGLARLISRMEGYWSLPVLLLDHNRTTPFTEGSRSTLKNEIVKLYTKILSWQMKIICLYFRCENADFLVSLRQIRNWDGSEANLKFDVGHIFNLTDNYTKEEVIHHLRRLYGATMSVEMGLRNLHSKNYDFVCDVCGNLDPDIWGGTYHRTHLMDIRDSSSRCPACDIIFSGVSQVVKPLDMRAELSLSVRKNSSLKLEYHWGVGGCDGNWKLEFFVQDGLPKPWPAIGNGRLLKGATSMRCTQLIHGWFYQCLAEHQLCKTRSQKLPTRVLHVGDERQEPHLHETKNEEAQYTALSHCWGGLQDSHLTTTRKVLGDRKKSIPMNTLSKTFFDAVLLTRAIGIEYLWIDSLCIIQDDEEDWVRESARMAEVYQNAALTISADGAANGSKGLFEPSLNRSAEETPVRPRHSADSTQVYVRETTLKTSGDHVHVIGQMEDEPLRGRGWALQEWLLSTRVVHFVRGEIFWECGKTQHCECQVTSQSPTVWEEQGSRHGGKFCYFRSGRWGRGETRGLFKWPTVVNDFSGRRLTRETDKLPALSGLAAFTKANAETDYVAGLWKSELPGGLLWQVDGEESRRHTDYYAPSWSWASIQGSIYFEELAWDNELPLKCKVLDLFTPLATSNPFGALQKSYIKVKGAIITLSKNMKRKAGALGIEGEGSGFSYWGELVVDVKGLAFEVTSADEVPVLIIKREIVNSDVIYGIALKPLRESGDTFIRVGFVWLSYKGHHWESWIRDILSVSERTITIF